MTPQFLAPQPLQRLVGDLSAANQAICCQGQAVITGKAGEYVAQILIQGLPEVAWSVLTDYDNFHTFLPNVVATQVLEESAQRTVVEQINTCQILFAPIQSRVCTENMVSVPGKLNFHLVEGDLAKLHGYWQVLPLSEPANHVLIKQVVTAKAAMGFLEGSFHLIFRETLKQTLTAIQLEIARRQQLLPYPQIA